MADSFARTNPLASVEDFVNRIQNFAPPPVNEIELWASRQESAMERAGGGWEGWLLVTEEGAKRLEDFDEAATNLGTEWGDELVEVLDEVRDSLLEGFPAWDEYGDSAEVSIDKVLAAQSRFITDMTLWSAAQLNLLERDLPAGMQTWFDSLSPLEQGAIGRLFQDNLPGFETFVAGVAANFEEMNALTSNHLLQVLPAILNSAVSTIPAQMQGLVEMLKLPAGDAELLTSAYEGGLRTFLAALPGDLSADVQAMIAALLFPDDPESIRLQGLNAGALFIDGVNTALAQGVNSVSANVTSSVTTPIVQTWRSDMQQRSPSRVAMSLGQNFIAGINMGLDSPINTDFTQRVLLPAQAMSNQAPTVNVQSDRPNVTVHVDDAGGDVADKTALGLMMAGVTERIEWAGPVSGIK
jgi:hypothetical protein